jgi:signal transduction histidine kinase
VHLTERDMLKGYEYGAVDYMTVPIIPELLRAKVRVFADLYRKTVALQRLEREAQRSQHLMLLGRLAASVSHEIRNPLASVVLHVGLLEEELREPSPDSATVVPKPSPRSRANSPVLRNSCRITSPSRAWSLSSATPQDLGAAVEAWAQEWQELMTTKGVTLQLDRMTHLGQAVFHASTLRRVVLNLVHNALDAMPQGGTLTLAGEISATHVHLHVRDTGSGIPAEKLPHIFEPLYTTKPEGTGLGLYIVREIITAHAGQITVQSRAGHGTTFTITPATCGRLRRKASPQHFLQSILKTLGYTPLVQRRIWQEYTDYLIPSLTWLIADNL